jgi:hypothetical protein
MSGNEAYWSEQSMLILWDFKFSRRRVWCSELSSGLYCRVKWLWTDVSEVRTASIIRDESRKPSTSAPYPSFCYAETKAHSSLMMEAVRTSETSVDSHFTRQYNPEDSSEHMLIFWRDRLGHQSCTKTGEAINYFDYLIHWPIYREKYCLTPWRAVVIEI